MTFNEVYNQFFKAVFAYIFLRMQNRELAEDLSSKTWQKVLDKFHTFDATKGEYRPWLFTIARNEINMYRRLYYVRRFFSLAEQEESISSLDMDISLNLEKKEQEEKVLLALRSLKSEQRDLIALKFYSGLNNREIATLTHLSESNVGTILHRTMKQLKMLLEDL